jgi:hypothetical protein
MKPWLGFLILISLACAPAAALGKGGPGEQPRWLEASENQVLATYFGRPHLTMVSVDPEGQQIRGVFSFQYVVACERCAHPSGSPTPRGRVVRVTFARATHRVSGPMKLCDPNGIQESLQTCVSG